MQNARIPFDVSHVHSAKRADLIHSYEFILNYQIFAVNLKISVCVCVPSDLNESNVI